MVQGRQGAGWGLVVASALLVAGCGTDAEETAAYRRACEAGANLGCVAAGRAYRDGRGVGADAATAAGLFQRVCEKGNAPSCLELGRLHERGEGVARDLARAFQLYDKGCQLGSDEACLYARRSRPAAPPGN